MSNFFTSLIQLRKTYFCLGAVIAITLAYLVQAEVKATEKKIDNQSNFVLQPTYTGLETDIPKTYLPTLNKLLRELKKVELLHVSITGHSDASPIRERSRHKIANNYQLSLARANSIADYLMQKLALTKNQISVISFGSDKPLMNNDTPEGRSLNRRIEVVVRTKGNKVAFIPGLSNELFRNKLDVIKKSRAIRRNKISLSLRNTDIVEVMDMLSRKERVNILLSKDVKATVSVNLYDLDLDQAIKAIASAAGYAVERRHGSYFIINRSEAGKYTQSNLTQLRTFKVQYTNPRSVEAILKNHLSNYGKITVLEERNLLVIEDTPAFIRRITKLLAEIDQRPKQILIEAKILEVTLDDSETFGLDWKKLFSADGGNGSFGTGGFAAPGSAGFFLDLVTPNVELALSALNTEGRVRTLSTPKLLALENQEASVVIGDRIGYRLTTTISQVTTESIKFLESGVILKVKPSIDSNNRVLLEIHPEVSTGTVTAGIPSQKTTEVTTQLLVNDGQTVFIGGLLKRTVSEGRDSIPILGAIPLLGRLFSSDTQISTNTETVVMITPHIIKDHDTDWVKKNVENIQRTERILEGNVKKLQSKIAGRSSVDDDFSEENTEHFDSINLSESGLAWNIADENIW